MMKVILIIGIEALWSWVVTAWYFCSTKKTLIALIA